MAWKGRLAAAAVPLVLSLGFATGPAQAASVTYGIGCGGLYVGAGACNLTVPTGGQFITVSASAAPAAIACPCTGGIAVSVEVLVNGGVACSSNGIDLVQCAGTIPATPGEPVQCQVLSSDGSQGDFDCESG